MDGLSCSANVRPHLTHAILSPPESIPQTACQSVQPFLHSSWQKVPILYNGPPLPLNIALSHRGSGTPCNTWLLRPTKVHNPNSPPIGSEVFAGLRTVIDRPTNRPRYSACGLKIQQSVKERSRQWRKASYQVGHTEFLWTRHGTSWGRWLPRPAVAPDLHC